ncbi:MAG TPA: lipid-binding SYLF domain-containing protein [Candidatus Angelobacter sp.]|nr:lipid-binding SYLF domain-containing protein [Candidatus Angelobacter sp.]
MKNTTRNLALAAVSLAAALFAITAQAADEDLQSAAEQAKSNFINADPSMKSLMDQAAAYAVFPNVSKGGLVVGGARGKGILFQHGQPIGQTTMTQASIGAQAGGQSFAEIIFFQNPEPVDHFKSGGFQMRADVSAVVATQGAARAAAYKDGMAVFSLPKKGLMVQASVGGQKFKFEPLTPTGR